jgi:hypothetical protein
MVKMVTMVMMIRLVIISCVVLAHYRGMGRGIITDYQLHNWPYIINTFIIAG